MNVYMTTGTFDFLKKIENKYPGEMVMMVNQNGALLLHETAGKTVFSAPRRYEAIEAIGEIPNEGFAIMNNIPVTEEGRPLFEHQMKGKGVVLKNVSGLIALRVLRPLTSNTYIIMSVWENETDYEKWQSSPANFLADHQNTISSGQQKIFESAPYTSEYMITE
ncbi:antibiotic biosynthesis monooxygenase family protein [Neobacillus mesonae]|uniref:Antibiotic biosynthesis monooxygenase n=1 Tax=Neobacillus mesonae TaxID=1193713 RepID=A0A3Q9QV31_9BACI|nr:antibiotic biosynthesis monooxygenase [Neobacillus mesonae]AZU61191.1 antibiotic biosynthesis monooxygenase [Neobacillus mesonae]